MREVPVLYDGHFYKNELIRRLKSSQGSIGGFLTGKAYSAAIVKYKAGGKRLRRK
jgi:hypothetical protein